MAQVTERRGGTAAGEVNPGIVTAYVVTAGLYVLSVLVQAFLAGRGWFVDIDLIDVHGYVANAVILIAVAQVVLAFLATAERRDRTLLLVLTGLLLVLTFAQIGLGYSGRDEAESAALHVLNGVLIFGLSTAHLVLAMGNRR